SHAGWANIGTEQVTYPLNGNYQQLQPDNTLGPVIHSISLGFGEGAILIKSSLARIDIGSGGRARFGNGARLLLW
nr:hypothetical protein [Nitrospiraceae bacterium]